MRERLEKLYREACESYAEGLSIMSDAEFNALEKQLKELGSDIYLKPYEALDDVDMDDSGLSLYPLETWDEILEFVRENQAREFCFTLKYNGVQAKVVTGRDFSGQSRTDTNPIDYTAALRDMFEHITERYLIAGECFVLDCDLPFLREKYNADIYKLARSAALSLLRTPQKHDDADLMCLNFKPFFTNQSFHTKSEMFDWFTSLNLDAPHYILKRFEPDEDVRDYIRTHIFTALDDGSPSDGIVMELNDLTVLPEINGKYKSTQVSLKVDKWGLTSNHAIIKRLILNSKRGGLGCVFEIEPVVLEDGATITKVNAFNVGLVLRTKLGKGDSIHFVRKSNGMCSFVYHNLE